MHIRFQGITIYKGSLDKVYHSFNQHTGNGLKDRTVAALYGPREPFMAVVLDGLDFDKFCAQYQADPHGKDAIHYQYPHPVESLIYWQPILDYLKAHPSLDAAGQPVQTKQV